MMASLLSFLFAFHLTIIIIMSSPLTSTSEVFTKQSLASPSAKPMEKLTQFHFYFHDNLTSKNPTTMQIVGPPKGSTGIQC
uniref:Dirigent protein n=1 Tax=Lotus japonicus TaxID=34305 RepID=I3SIL2_LOTJA|nr:unknown [Lotus japonicus]